jgi:hypothetical protein
MFTKYRLPVESKIILAVGELTLIARWGSFY